MNKINNKVIYIILFSILYIFTAFISMTHAIAFFSLANVYWMGIILAITFEIGQAAVLFSILTDKSKRSKIMPWCLMGVLTFVQILGNVFSSYKYILTNSINDLRYFKEPIFIWTDLPDNITTVIVTYLLGAILPVICLLLTSMVTNYLNDDEDNKNQENSTTKEEKIEDLVNNNEETIKNNEQPIINEQENSTAKEENIEDLINNNEEKNNEQTIINEQENSTAKEEKVDPIEEELKKKNSRFINL